jgi:hypothetical protein
LQGGCDHQNIFHFYASRRHRNRARSTSILNPSRSYPSWKRQYRAVTKTCRHKNGIADPRFGGFGGPPIAPITQLGQWLVHRFGTGVGCREQVTKSGDSPCSGEPSLP